MNICKNPNCNKPVRSSDLCSKHYRDYWEFKKTGHVVQERVSFDQCQAPGCDQPTGKGRSTYCEMHHARLRRNGSFDLQPTPQDGDTKEHSAGYILEYRKNHIKFGNGRHYQHRLNFYDKHGEGPFKCFDCGKSVSWDDMHVHHLDEIKDNNAVENLVASCPKCNHNASIEKNKEALRKVNTQNHITYNGITKHVYDWSDDLGIPPHVIKWRVKKWGTNKALSEPYSPYRK